jgi:predicted ABC-type ATPase
MPDIFVIAGINGAGKTTVATRLLPHFLNIPEFLNADEIAKGLSPFNPSGAQIAAGRIFLHRLEEMIKQERSFAFETTLAGKGYLKTLKACKAKGYVIHLLYVWIASPSLAIQRVKARVRQGGHFVESDVIKRRYGRSLANFIQLYFPLADEVLVYDNTTMHSEIADGFIIHKMDANLKIFNPVIWHDIQQQAETHSND